MIDVISLYISQTDLEESLFFSFQSSLLGTLKKVLQTRFSENKFSCHELSLWNCTNFMWMRKQTYY